jgi:hypothetical protein
VTVNFLLQEYYNDQAKMNDWARILQSPASISQLWVEELRVRGCEASIKEMAEPEQLASKAHPLDCPVRPDDRDE